MKKILILIAIALILPFQTNASFLGLSTKNDLDTMQVQIDLLRYRIEMLANQIASIGNATVKESKFGADATLPIAGTVYNLSGSGISSSATTIGLTSLTLPQTGYEIIDSDLSSTFYVTLEPGSRTRQEVVSCTTVTQNVDNTATLTGCSRGLLPISPYTASSTYRFAHAGGTSVVFSNPPQLYNEFAGKTNDETISGTWTYASTTIPRQDSYLAPTLNAEFAPKKYVDDIAIAGSPIATESVAGISILATQAQTAAGTATSSSYSLIPQNRYFNATSSATTTVPVTNTSGKLSSGFIDQTVPYTWSGAHIFSSTSTFSATTTFTSIVNGAFPDYFGEGSDGAATISATTTLTSDKFYTNLTINSGVTLHTGGYRVFVNGTLTNNGTISGNGANGSNGTNGSGSGNAAGGGGGVASASSTISNGISGSTGGTGGAVAGGNGNVGVAGLPLYYSFATSTGANGGAGANSSQTGLGAAGGGGGTASKKTSPSNVFIVINPYIASSTIGVAGGAAGGGGGGANNGTGGGGGGGGGASGSHVFVAAKTFSGGASSIVSSNGGAGGNGGTGGGGGGGGGGGAGGIITIITSSYTNTGTITVTGGSGGSGGTGDITGTAGSTGVVGSSWLITI